MGDMEKEYRKNIIDRIQNFWDKFSYKESFYGRQKIKVVLLHCLSTILEEFRVKLITEEFDIFYYQLQRNFFDTFTTKTIETVYSGEKKNYTNEELFSLFQEVCENIPIIDSIHTFDTLFYALDFTLTKSKIDVFNTSELLNRLQEAFEKAKGVAVYFRDEEDFISDLEETKKIIETALSNQDGVFSKTTFLEFVNESYMQDELLKNNPKV